MVVKVLGIQTYLLRKWDWEIIHYSLEGYVPSMGWLKGKSEPETTDFPMKIMELSCNFSLKPINWDVEYMTIYDLQRGRTNNCFGGCCDVVYCFYMFVNSFYQFLAS